MIDTTLLSFGKNKIRYLFKISINFMGLARVGGRQTIQESLANNKRSKWKEEHSQSKIESCKPTRKSKIVGTAFQKSTRKPTGNNG